MCVLLYVVRRTIRLHKNQDTLVHSANDTRNDNVLLSKINLHLDT